MDDWLLFGGALALGYVIWFLFYLKLYPSKKPCLHCDALTDEPDQVCDACSMWFSDFNYPEQKWDISPEEWKQWYTNQWEVDFDADEHDRA